MKPFSVRSLMSLLAALAILPLTPNAAKADTPALSFTGGLALQPGLTLSLGWSFSLETTVTVTGLGYFDSGEPGLAMDHPIAIWLDAAPETPLIESTVPAGTEGTLIDGFRYVSIAPLLLGPGDYTIMAFTEAGADEFVALAEIMTAPGIVYGGGRIVRDVPGLVFTDANQAEAPGGFFGPNFLIASEAPTVAVPEGGGSMLLLTLGLAGVLAARMTAEMRREKQSAA